jgi:hypothetical protein
MTTPHTPRSIDASLARGIRRGCSASGRPTTSAVSAPPAAT